jgi:hypothetical protein
MNLVSSETVQITVTSASPSKWSRKGRELNYLALRTVTGSAVDVEVYRAWRRIEINRIHSRFNISTQFRNRSAPNAKLTIMPSKIPI